jgi:hypothetical protein
MSIDNFTEYVTLKYNDSYYENNYTIEDGVVFRRPISNIESQAEKGVCLFQCFTHFTNQYISQASTDFEVSDKELGEQTRCCCSQQEGQGLLYKVIRHKETGLEFVIGRVCFEKLFKGEKDKLKYFFQPNCKYCGNKVKKNMKNTPTKGFCGIKCLKEFNDREEQIRKKKEWDDGAPEREAKLIAQLAEREAQILERERIRKELEEHILEEKKIKQKKWDDEAPEREAKRLAKIAELEEIKRKFPYGIWNNCQRCNRENKSDKQKKYKICENCCKK